MNRQDLRAKIGLVGGLFVAVGVILEIAHVPFGVVLAGVGIFALMVRFFAF